VRQLTSYALDVSIQIDISPVIEFLIHRSFSFCLPDVIQQRRAPQKAVEWSAQVQRKLSNHARPATGRRQTMHLSWLQAELDGGNKGHHRVCSKIARNPR
jgi:hypothetical protein